MTSIDGQGERARWRLYAVGGHSIEAVGTFLARDTIASSACIRIADDARVERGIVFCDIVRATRDIAHGGHPREEIQRKLWQQRRAGAHVKPHFLLEPQASRNPN